MAAAAPALSGLEGFTHVQEFYKSLKVIFFGFLNNFQYGILKQSCKSKIKGKRDQSKTSLYLIICGILILMLVLLTYNAPKTLAVKAHCITAEPLGILSEKTQLHFFWIWLCWSIHTDSYWWSDFGLQASIKNYNQVEESFVFIQIITAAIIERCSPKSWATFSLWA